MAPICLRITCTREGDREWSRGHEAPVAIWNFQPHRDFRGTASVGPGKSPRNNPWSFERTFFDGNTHFALVIDIHARLNGEGDILFLVHFRRLFNSTFVIRCRINRVSAARWFSKGRVDPC